MNEVIHQGAIHINMEFVLELAWGDFPVDRKILLVLARNPAADCIFLAILDVPIFDQVNGRFFGSRFDPDIIPVAAHGR